MLKTLTLSRFERYEVLTQRRKCAKARRKVIGGREGREESMMNLPMKDAVCSGARQLSLHILFILAALRLCALASKGGEGNHQFGVKNVRGAEHRRKSFGIGGEKGLIMDTSSTRITRYAVFREKWNKCGTERNKRGTSRNKTQQSGTCSVGGGVTRRMPMSVTLADSLAERSLGCLRFSSLKCA